MGQAVGTDGNPKVMASIFSPFLGNSLEVSPKADPLLFAESVSSHLPGAPISEKNRVSILARLNDQFLSSFCPPPVQNQSPTLGGHTLQETVGSLSTGIARLKSSLHPCTPIIIQYFIPGKKAYPDPDAFLLEKGIKFQTNRKKIIISFSFQDRNIKIINLGRGSYLLRLRS
jgi:hypothetical protein